jgi:hypothetical protein
MGVAFCPMAGSVFDLLEAKAVDGEASAKTNPWLIHGSTMPEKWVAVSPFA